MMNDHNPDFFYTIDPALPYLIQLLRILQWKKGYTQQSIILTLMWTLICLHSTITSYTIPIWILSAIVYYNQESSITVNDKLTVELIKEEIQLELLPSLDYLKEWCRSQSKFVLDQSFQYQSSLFLSFYLGWILSLKFFGAHRVIWFIGCLCLAWKSPLFEVIRYSYHRATTIIYNNNNNKEVSFTTKITKKTINNMTINKEKNYIDRFYRFTVIEHQRWWPHCGWSNRLLKDDRPNWSDEYLSKVPSIQSFHLPPPTTRIDKKNNKMIKTTWKWINKDWEIDQNHNIDEQGWEYGINWKLWSSKSFGLRVLTRRRHWVRDARLVEETITESNNDNQSMTSAIPIPRLMKSSSSTVTTCCSSFEDSLCTTPTTINSSAPNSFDKLVGLNRQYPSVKQQESFPTIMDSHPWLLR